MYKRRFYIIILIFFIWYLGSVFKLWNSFIIPSPEKVIKSFFILSKNGKLLNSVAISCSYKFKKSYNRFWNIYIFCSSSWNSIWYKA